MKTNNESSLAEPTGAPKAAPADENKEKRSEKRLTKNSRYSGTTIEHMRGKRIRFKQDIGGLAKIEGTAETGESGIDLEMAMTESIKGPVKGILKRSIPYSELKDLRYTKRFLRPPVLHFTSDNLRTFDSIPGATGFEYSVNPVATKSECRSFVNEVQLAIAEATMERFTRQIDRLGSDESD